jgi:hypothetical protein
MSEPPKLPRVYGDKEIGRLLQRATELQEKAPTGMSSGGMTLAELEDIAAEAGIDPAYLRQAATELATRGGPGNIWSRVVGDELMIVREVTVPGELPDDAFERIVVVIQEHVREHGQPSLLGHTLTWRSETVNKTRTLQIVVTSRDGETRIRVEESLHQLAAGLFGGTVAGVGLGAGLGVGVPLGVGLGSTLLAVTFPLGVAALSYIGCREIYRALTRGRRRALSGVFEEVVAEVRARVESESG